MREIIRIGLLTFAFFCLHLPMKAQQDTILQRIILIGDGGELTNGKHPVVDAVRKTIPLDKKTTILFLGDNLYKTGLPDDQYEFYNEAKAVLDSQLSIADNTPAKVYMIPGNHDWENGGRGGYAAIIREQLYVDLLGKDNVKFYPENGCPGPVEVPLGNDVTLILFDSQWWLHAHDKPGLESDCPYKTEEEFLTQIEDLIARNSKKLVLLASHHPFKSQSVHGGYFTLKQHLFPFTELRKNLYIPLPGLGSIYPIVRSVFGTPQDLKHPLYANMINQVTDAVKAATNLVFVAGHDHGLQLIKDSSYYYIVSGGGCKTQRVSDSKKSLYTERTNGFCVLEVSVNKNVTATYYSVTDSIHQTFNSSLLNFSAPPEPVDTSTRIVDVPGIKYKDTINISASNKYATISGFKKWTLGQNYRKVWSTPVNMKVFNINKEKGGLRIISMGGGKQTRTLHLVDKTGKEWLLRTVEKNPSGILPSNLRGTFAQDLVQDFISAAHPYGALAIPQMAEAINITAPHPELFFVPDDPSFGYYQSLFANKVCMLEEKDPVPDGQDTKSTAKVFDKLIEENDHRADQHAVLKARLLDMTIGDFDRHFGQWRWATNDTGKGKLYYPIPKDRDQAFFYSDGRLLKFASLNLLPYLKGFRRDIPNIEWMNYSARDFDRLFLTGLDEKEWKNEIDSFRLRLNDSVITKAIKDLPPEAFAISGEKIIKKMSSRRDLLPKAGMKYYKFISRKVNIIGSNQEEYFKITNHPEGLQVRVYARAAGNDTSFVMYNRVFQPSVTREIRLYGLNGNDLFEIDKEADSRIKIRIIGGRGNDTFNIKGNVTNLLYDIDVEGNYIVNDSRSKNRFSNDPQANYYNILGFNYNKSKFPQIRFGSNSDDGFLIGTGFTRTTYSFRNTPFSTRQDLKVLYAPSRSSFGFNYKGEFNHITRNIDIVLDAGLKYPGHRNFFGLGNTSTSNVSSGYNYNRLRYKTFEFFTAIRRRFFDALHVMAGPYYYQYCNRYTDNENTILGKPDFGNFDSADIYSNKSYFGGKLSIVVDNRNHEFFPSRGILWTTDFISTAGLKGMSDNFTKYSSEMSIYASFSDPANLVLVLGLGGSKILSKNFEFFQASTIGSGRNFHGFRKDRYAGKSSAYGSLEMRLKLFELKSYVIPGSFGLTSFYDIGRVWLDGESSRKWHTAYGGGIYFMPFNLVIISAKAGFSGKEKIFNLTVGSTFDLRF